MRALLVDDEELALDRLARLLAPAADVEIVGRARDALEAMALVGALRPDVVFLDVEMPGASGLDVVRSLRPPRPRIVFCTGHDQYAVQAFELHAVDYLLKPVARERLDATLARLREPRGEGEAAADRLAGAAPAGEARLLVRAGERYRVVAQHEVEGFTSDEGLSYVHLEAGRLLVDLTLDELERRVDPAQFFRISRAALVRLDRVVEVTPLIGGQGEARLRSGLRLRISRRRFRPLLDRLEGRSSGPSR
jgi:two-component system LytT family response regulator